MMLRCAELHDQSHPALVYVLSSHIKKKEIEIISIASL